MDAVQIYIRLVLMWTLLWAAPTDADQLPAPKQNSFLDWLLSIFQPPPFVTTTAKPTTTTTPHQCAACTCGTANTVKRIVGGYETKVNQYPWMAMMLFRGHFYCGGTLISDLYVVSAAHCLRGFPKNYVSVRLMAHNLGDRSTRVIDRAADKVMVHDQYATRNNDHDIGLVRLDKKVEMSTVLRPVCMAMPDNTYAGEEAIIIGWGATSEGGSLGQNLMEVIVPILSQMACRETKYGPDRITDNMLCAGVDKGGLDACQGDSGGPLLVKMDDLNTFHLAGVVSWGEGCAREDYPGVYTRVSQYLKWIDENTRDSCKCDMPTQKVGQVEIVIED